MYKSITVSTKVSGMGLSKTYEKDNDGYYKVRLGRLNSYNRQGVYYRVNDLNKLTGPGSTFHRRISEGYLRAEVNHPEEIRKAGEIKDPNKRIKELVRAIMRINLENVCGHIKEVTFAPTGKTEKGFTNEIIEVYGWVKPSGPKKIVLQEALDNPNENVAFSIRSLVKNSFVNGTWIKDVIDISTWDYVYEPGVAGSSKWGGAGVEELDIDLPELSEKDIEGIVDVGLESQCVDGKCLINKLKQHCCKNPTLNWLLG
jgi:hypothetical protein